MKKLLCSLILLLAGLVLTNNYTQAATVIAPGDLFKMANNSGVYYYGADYKRHLFSNEVTFWSWHIGSWKDQNVRVITQDEFDALNVGNNITMKPGNSFIEFDNSEILYAVEPGGMLCKVNPAFANKQKIWKAVIQSSFQVDYKEAADCSLSDYTAVDNMPVGSIFRYEDGIQTFYMSSDGLRPIDTADGWSSNGFKSNSVLTVKAPAPGIILPMRAEITAQEVDFSIDNELNLRTETVDNKTIVASHTLWQLFEIYKTAIKNRDKNSADSVTYNKPDECQDTTVCNELYDWYYKELNRYSEADFVVKQIDDKQAILNTELKKRDGNYIEYEKFYLYFIKSGNEYKLVTARSSTWGSSMEVSVAENVKNAIALSVDSDNDGLTDSDENCVISSFCNKTNPFNRDSDGDGLWDGIEHELAD